MVTDKLKSYGAAHREMGLSAVMNQSNTIITELKIHTNERDNKNGRCGDLNPLDTSNDFYLFTQPSITFHAKTVT